MTTREEEAVIEKLLTVPEVSEILGVKPGTVYSLCAEDQLRHIRVGRKIKVPESALTEFVQQGGSK